MLKQNRVQNCFIAMTVPELNCLSYSTTSVDLVTSQWTPSISSNGRPKKAEGQRGQSAEEGGQPKKAKDRRRYSLALLYLILFFCSVLSVILNQVGSVFIVIAWEVTLPCIFFLFFMFVRWTVLLQQWRQLYFLGPLCHWQTSVYFLSCLCSPAGP